MMMRASSPSNPAPRRAGLSAALLALLAVASAPGAFADRIVTKAGQTLDGIIREENKFNILIDVRGIEIPVPHERIQSVTRNTLDENARSLLDRAFETLSRDDIPTARTLVEQARGLNSQTPRIQDDLQRLDAQITDLERRGGSAEDRRIRAENMLRRAQEDYDRIRTDEGNLLLIQALRIDPSYEEAQRLIEEKLSSPGNTDTLLAAEYFVDVLWPENVREDSPVIPLLPAAYVDLAGRFGQTLDIRRAQRFSELLTTMSEAFQKNPAWAAGASAEARALIARPVVELLSDQVKTNLVTGDYEFALDKMKGWANPTDSEDLAMLFARAYVGAGKYDSAASVLSQGLAAFPSNVDFQPNLNALDLLRKGDAALAAGNVDEAGTTYEQIFTNRANLLQEITEKAGNTLSDLKFEQMNNAVGQEPRWRAADLAALVMTYSTKDEQRFRAAAVLNSAIQTLSWKLRVQWFLNGTEITPGDVNAGSQAALAGPLAVNFDDSSPFVIELAINAQISESQKLDAVQQISNNGTLATPVPVNELGFTMTAMHPILGPLMQAKWNVSQVPALVVSARTIRGEVTPPDQVPVHLNLVSGETIRQFSLSDLGAYMTPSVSNLALHVGIQRMNDLLEEQTRREQSTPAQ